MSDFEKINTKITEDSVWVSVENKEGDVIYISFNFEFRVFRKSIITPYDLINKKITYEEVWFLINEVEKKLLEDNVSDEERNRILNQMRGVAKEYKEEEKLNIFDISSIVAKEYKEEEKLDEDKLK